MKKSLIVVVLSAGTVLLSQSVPFDSAQAGDWIDAADGTSHRPPHRRCGRVDAVLP